MTQNLTARLEAGQHKSILENNGEDDGMSLDNDFWKDLECVLTGVATSTVNPDSDFSPWPSKHTFLISLIMNIPCHPISVSMLKILLIWARTIGALNVPSYDEYSKASASVTENVNRDCQQQFTGSAGNMLYVNDISILIAQDFSNPLTRPLLNLYGQHDNGLHDICDSDMVLRSVNHKVTASMVRIAKDCHVYIHEAVQLTTSIWVWPIAWFVRDDVLYGKGHSLEFNGQTFTIKPDTSILFPISSILISLIASATCKISVFCGNETVHGINPNQLMANGAPLYYVPLLFQIDDLSGNKSKRWNVHYATVFVNALLKRPYLLQESQIRFFGISKNAQPLEIMEAFVNQVTQYYTTPTKAYDCENSEYPLLGTGDGPMLAVLANSMGMKANYPCWHGHFGGSTAWKTSAQGILEAMQPCPPKTPQYIRDTVSKQLSLAQKGKHTKVTDMETATGIIDQFADDAITVMLEHYNNIWGRGSDPDDKINKSNRPQAMQDYQHHLESSGCLYNPLLDLEDTCGFDVCSDLPTGILHVGDLGAGKYLIGITKKKLGSDVFDQLRVWMEAAPTAGIAPGVQLYAVYMIKYAGSLVGKELRI
jgi:hypothetical protein